jgi:hypothetical protein
MQIHISDGMLSNICRINRSSSSWICFLILSIILDIERGMRYLQHFPNELITNGRLMPIIYHSMNLLLIRLSE